MNANSKQPAPVIKLWLVSATSVLASADIDSARLDSELILSHTLKKGRTYLHAHGDDSLTDRQVEIADARLQLRLDRVPIAYIIGHKEFYGRKFKVTSATLIPRPESEAIVDAVKSLQPKNVSFLAGSGKLIDVGTGSGCIGITIKLEIPDLNVSLLDISPQALNVAGTNATNLGADVELIKSDLLDNYPIAVDYIVANLPYVDPAWDRSPETNHEPQLALFARDGGLELIYKLIAQAAQTITDGGYLILEADPRQLEPIILYANDYNFNLVSKTDFCLILQKV
jgi:release factor glutamine methyltransferase